MLAQNSWDVKIIQNVDLRKTHNNSLHWPLLPILLKNSVLRCLENSCEFFVPAMRTLQLRFSLLRRSWSQAAIKGTSRTVMGSGDLVNVQSEPRYQ
jgi:hypothetical protein